MAHCITQGAHRFAWLHATELYWSVYQAIRKYSTWVKNALFAEVPLAGAGKRMGTPAIYKGQPRAKVSRMGQMRDAQFNDSVDEFLIRFLRARLTSLGRKQHTVLSFSQHSVEMQKSGRLQDDGRT